MMPLSALALSRIHPCLQGFLSLEDISSYNCWKFISYNLGQPVSNSAERHVSSKLEFEGRVFTLDLLRFSNGSFANISEDPVARIGAISISIKAQQGVNSSTLIPDRRGSIFSSMIGELIAEKTKGIAVVSLYLREEVDPQIMKILLSEISKLLAQD
jgi:hypothetical protein